MTVDGATDSVQNVEGIVSSLCNWDWSHSYIFQKLQNI